MKAQCCDQGDTSHNHCMLTIASQPTTFRDAKHLVWQVVACRLDGHTCVVNSVALALAGIHHDTPEPPGGIIVKDHKGGIISKLKLKCIVQMTRSTKFRKLFCVFGIP